MTYIVIGRNSRMAKSIFRLASELGISVILVSLEEFPLLFKGKSKDYLQEYRVIWCLGAGSSFSSRGTEDSKLLEFLRCYHNLSLPSGDSFIYYSSGGSLYGENPGKVTEDSPVIANSFYAKEKSRCEDVVKLKISNWFRRTLILRLPNVYTLNSNLDVRKGLIETAQKSIVMGETLRLSVSTKSRRQYVTHRDVSRATMEIIRNWESSYLENESFQLLNLTTMKDYSIEEIIDIFQKVYNSRFSRISFDPSAKQETVILDSNRLGELLPWTESNWLTLEESLRKFIQIGHQF